MNLLYPLFLFFFLIRIPTLLVNSHNHGPPTPNSPNPTHNLPVLTNQPNNLQFSDQLICTALKTKSFKTSAFLSLHNRKPNTSWYLFSLLLLAGDLETNPGPSYKFPCGSCSRPCKKNQIAIQCDTCDAWYHKKCLSMNSKVFEALANTSVSWICCQCGIPNFDSSLFNSSISHTANSFSTLSALDESIHVVHDTFPTSPPHSNFRPPISSSTPRPRHQKHPSNSENKAKNKKPTPPFRKNKSNCVTSLLINFRSLLNKKDTVNNLIHSLSLTHNLDIIFGTETWLSDKVTNSELNLTDYDIYRRDRTERAGGGVFLCIKKSLNSTLIHKSKLTESIFVKINRPGKIPILLCCTYRPPDSSLDDCEKLCNEILTIKTKHKNSLFWLAGDFNLPDIDWKNLTISDTPAYALTINRRFLDLVSELGLTQIVNEATRGNSILDLFFTNNPSLIKKSTVISGVSDHEAVTIESKLHFQYQKQPKRTIPLWHKANLETLKSDASKFTQRFLDETQERDVNVMWSSFRSNLEKILKDNVPTKETSSKYFPPWITTQTKRLIRNKQIWFQKAKQRNTFSAWQKYKNYKRLAQKFCRQSHDNYVKDLITDDKTNKKFWTYIKSQRQENSGISDLLDDQTWITDPKQKANLFNKQFSKVFSDPSPPLDSYPEDADSSTPKIPQITINPHGILKLLLNINVNKAPGPDNIPGRLLKLCAEELHIPLTKIFQKSLDTGTIPDDCKTAHIIPLFKKADKAKAENYRPISLTSIACKLLEHVVYSSIINHLDDNDILCDFQHGFRQRRSCESQLLNTLRDFFNCLDRSSQVDAILLDFSKAFDKVDHSTLLLKMHNYGIQGCLLDWTESFLRGRTQRVLVDGALSDPSPVLSGVPQGTVLGPLFFLIYINDIHKELSPGTIIRLFADDSLLYRTIASETDCIILQKDLDALQRWERRNKMEFHPDKCTVLKITNKRHPVNHIYNIHNIPLSVDKTAKYLGVTLDSTLSWDHHINSIFSKANFTLSFLERNLKRCPRHVKEQCFNTLVRPILEYCCCAWDPHLVTQIDKLEKINKRAARFVTGNYTLEHGNTLKNMLDLGWQPLQERRAKSKVTMMYKIQMNLITVDKSDLLPSSSPRTPHNFFIPQSKKNSHLYSYFPSTIRLWNSIPEHIKTSDSLDIFKSHIQNHIIKTSYEN